ncbi:HAMP domain-containing protein [Nocardia colli]|uniref:histidine kinase n=1 Tax=Nocardia colli TaxID=2545717 RepID=A0A5N0ENK0_9NOCA|nr:HAMP domain-containing protein [Nocardia colli]KAA8889011.1 HAMP domain-containing protein [Nocardia colli]
MLRARITAVAVAATTVAIVVIVGSFYGRTSEVVADQLDRSLNDRADTVLAVLDSGGSLSPRPDTVEQILLPDGTVRLLGSGYQPLPISDADRAVARTGSRTVESDLDVDGQSYGLLTRPRPGGGAVMVAQRYHEPERIAREFFWRALGITMIAVVVAALLSWLAIGRILRPVRRLLAATERISSTQDLRTPLPAAGRDEIGRLTGSFDTMLAALRRSRDQQHRLVQDAGQELRTPLTSIRGSAELLHSAELDAEAETRVLATLVQESAALDELVAELVELASDKHSAESDAR